MSCSQSYLVQPGPLENCPCSSAVEHSLGKGDISGSSPDEGTRLIACYQVNYHYRTKEFIRSGRPFSGPLFFLKADIWRCITQTMMPKWQQSEKGGTACRSLSEGRILWVQGPEIFFPKIFGILERCNLRKDKKLFNNIPVTLGEAINAYIKVCC